MKDAHLLRYPLRGTVKQKVAPCCQGPCGPWFFFYMCHRHLYHCRDFIRVQVSVFTAPVTHQDLGISGGYSRTPFCIWQTRKTSVPGRVQSIPYISHGSTTSHWWLTAWAAKIPITVCHGWHGLPIITDGFAPTLRQVHRTSRPKTRSGSKATPSLIT